MEAQRIADSENREFVESEVKSLRLSNEKLEDKMRNQSEINYTKVLEARLEADALKQRLEENRETIDQQNKAFIIANN